MGDKTGIQWTEATWNPTTGCDKVSPGCGMPRFDGDDTGGCYAMEMAKRLKAMGQAKYQTDGDPRTSGPGFGVAIHPDALDQPRRWTRPRLIFVNSMSDLFHARVPVSFVREVFEVIADTPRHTYQALTKRSLRLARLAGQLEWPPNLWMGVSVENADELRRVDHLRQVPAAVRFLSCEPLLGPLDGLDLDGIGWVIAGGESGRHARPMHPDWARSLRDRCVAAGVPYFHKQNGEWAPRAAISAPNPDTTASVLLGPDGKGAHLAQESQPGHEWLWRVGKHAAGRELDGRTWDEFPAQTLAVAL